MDLPSTSERVSMHTAEWKNQRIQQDMEMRIWYYAQNPEKIDERLRELDEEWDIERALETNAATLALTGTVLGMFSRKYLLIPTVVTGFLLQHALQGWCPPVPLFRRLGIRTQGEIEAERHALMVLRGDYRAAGDAGQIMDRVDQALQAIAQPQPRTETAAAYH
jgi:hypothetical protein